MPPARPKATGGAKARITMLKKSCTAQTEIPPRAPQRSHPGSSGGTGAEMPTIFPLMTNSVPIQAWESRERTEAQTSLARYRSSTGTGAVRKLFQL